MSKLHATDHPIHELLTRRWSPRAFADTAVKPEKLNQIFEAARWSASSSNEQPWRFIVAMKDQPSAFSKLLACLAPAKQSWAANAPVLILGCAALNFARNGKHNAWAVYDLGQSVAYLTFEATAQNLFVHQMAGFDAAAARTVMDWPMILSRWLRSPWGISAIRRCCRRT